MAEIIGTPANDELLGDVGPDTLFGLEGDDAIFGFADNDFLFGNQGSDLLDGDEGDDTIFGGQGDDQIVDIGGGNDQIFGNLGNDLINGTEGNDQVFGGQGDDLITGGAGNDLVSGDKGNDILFGIDNSNTSNPGLGEIDTLTGGEGFDFFYLGSELSLYYVGLGSEDFALITDFNPAEDILFVGGTDRVTLSDLNLGQAGTGAGIFTLNNDVIAFIPGTNSSELNFSLL
ncbi:calcium-binding protein [Capilliphycus salinus ALCB114379]|uniref:calcium-binding protein n=1 Tax=Capilliphycus salinus TaxID=2768948 RepID=UPI0039A5DE21